MRACGHTGSVWGLLAWVGGAMTTAFQPGRLAAGLLIALLIYAPGVGWDVLTGRHIEATGFLGEPYDDAEQAAVQATLRRLATDYLPDQAFEGARVPAEDLAAALQARAVKAPDAGARDALLIAAARAGSLAPLGSFQALVRAQATAASLVVDGMVGANAADVALGIRTALWATPRAVWQRDPVFAVIFGLWCTLVLTVGAGAVARMEAVQVSGRGVPLAADGLRFAAERWSDLVLAWLAPLGIAAVLGLLCAVWGLLFRGEWTGWIGGALYIVPLGIGLVAGLALIIGALGAPYSSAAVACDGLDALDASQRGAIYAIGRPGLWLLVALMIAGVAGAGLAVVRIVAWVMTGFTATAVSLGADFGSSRNGALAIDALGVSPNDAPVAWNGPGIAVSWWVSLVSVAVAGAFLSLLGGLLARGYLALRQRCDGQPREDIWPFELPADISDGAGTADATRSASAAVAVPVQP